MLIDPRKIAIFSARHEVAVAGLLGQILTEYNMIPVLGHRGVGEEKAQWIIAVVSPHSADDFAFSQTMIEHMQGVSRDRIIVVKLAGTLDLPPVLKFVRGEDFLLEPGEELATFPMDRVGSKSMEAVAIGIANHIEDTEIRLRWPQRKRDRSLYERMTSKLFIGALASALVLVGAGAVNYRVQADMYRERAESSEQFTAQLLTKLTQTLPNTARWEVLDVIANDLTLAFASVPIDQLDENQIGQRAQLFHLIGEMHDRNSRQDEASAAFELAYELTEELLAQSPNDTQRIFKHSQSAFWLGNSEYRAGNLTQAAASFENYQMLTDRLIAIEPENPLYRAEAAHALNNSGVVALESGDSDTAANLFTAAIAGFQNGPVEAGAASVLDISNAQGWLAEAEEARGNLSAALASRLAELNALTDLREQHPDQFSQRRRLANALHEVSKIQLLLGQVQAAGDTAERSITIYSELFNGSPENNLFRRSFVEALTHRARIALTEDNIIRAQLLADEVRRVRAQSDPTGTDDDQIIQRARLSVLQGEIALSAGALDTALRNALSAASLSRTAVSTERTEPAKYAIRASYLLAEVLQTMGQIDEANTSRRHALEEIERFNVRDNEIRDIESRLRYKLSDFETAYLIKLELENTGYAHPSFAEFWDSADMASLSTENPG